MIVQQKPPSLLSRIGNVFRPQRATWIKDGVLDSHDGRYDMLRGPGDSQTPYERRRLFTDADFVALHEAIFACVRIRTRMIARPKVKLVRIDREGEIADELPNSHPAMQAYLAANESLTTRQGAGLIEQHKLTSGKAYWIKRRDGMRTPVEFEVWDPRSVEVRADPRKPWVPGLFRLHKANGSVVDVEPADVVWFRHLIDPRNPMNGLAPITATRVLVETGYEAARFNQAFFDNSTNIGHLYKVPEGGPAEVDRIRQDLRRSHQGTDNAGRDWVSEGDLEEVSGPLSHKDMQFVEQGQWTKENVAMVYELAPTTLGDLRAGSFENTKQGNVKDWTAIQDQLDNTLAEWTEFMLWPDFGRDLAFMADYSDIPALQGDLKLMAEIDQIKLVTRQRTANELRARDGLEGAPWGDMPEGAADAAASLIRAGFDPQAALAAFGLPPMEHIGIPPVTVQPAYLLSPGEEAPVEGEEGPRLARRRRGFAEAEDDIVFGWERRLERERRRIIEHLLAGRGMRLSVDDVDTYPFDEWWERYGEAVQQELQLGYFAGLDDAGFVAETSPTPAQQLAARYARDRAGRLLKLGGPESVAEATRHALKAMVADTIEQGQTNTYLRDRLAESELFTSKRAHVIARTEIAEAQGESTLAAYQSLGHEGKRWSWPGGAPDGICDVLDGQVAFVNKAFPGGRKAPPAHPNCRCALEPVREMPR